MHEHQVVIAVILDYIQQQQRQLVVVRVHQENIVYDQGYLHVIHDEVIIQEVQQEVVELQNVL